MPGIRGQASVAWCFLAACPGSLLCGISPPLHTHTPLYVGVAHTVSLLFLTPFGPLSPLELMPRLMLGVVEQFRLASVGLLNRMCCVLPLFGACCVKAQGW